MKNTLITLSSIATLAVSANAQTFELTLTNDITLNGVKYVENDHLVFANQADFLAGNVGRSFAYNQNTILDGSTTGGSEYKFFTPSNGALGEAGNTFLGIASWAAGNVANWSYAQYLGTMEVTLSNAITIAGVNYAVNDHLRFANQADFLAGNVANSFAYHQATILDGSSSGSEYKFFTPSNGALGEAGSTFLGIASWAAGNVTNFTYSQVNPTSVPEPSSTALLGLGALGLLARRKR